MSRLTDPVYLAAKAAVAASIAVAASRGMHVPDALSSGFAALVCVSPTAYAGLRRGLTQLGGASIAGAVTALVLALWPGSHEGPSAALVVLFSVGITAWACDRLRWGDGFTVAGFTVLYLVVLPFHSLSEALRVRFEAVLIGAASATAVNLAVSWLRARAIRERRVRVTRATIAAPLDATAVACVSPARRAAAADGWGAAFEAIAELRVDLDGHAREVLLPQGAKARDEALRDLRVADALGDVAHLGRHLALLLEGDDRVEAALGDALSQVAAALASGTELAGPRAALEASAATTGDPALAAAATRMAAALRQCG